MKKLILALMLLCGVAQAQNPTLVYGTNGIVNVPPTTHAGKVTVGLKTNAIGAGKVYSSVDGGPNNFQWITPSSASPGGLNGNIQYNDSGTLGGSNAFTINFSGLNARLSNAMSGMIEFAAPTTNINVYARRAVFGPTNTVPPDIYTDFFIKGQKSDFSIFTYDGPAIPTPLTRIYMQHYNQSLGGFELGFGRLSGGSMLDIFMDVNANSPILYRGVGAADIQFGIVNGQKISFGNVVSTSLTTEYMYLTNDAVVINKQVVLPQQTLTYNGTTNIVWNVTNAPNAFVILTNYAKLIPTNYYAGGSYQITVLANVNGAGLSYDSKVLFSGGTVPTITTNGLDLLNFAGVSTNGVSTNLIGTALQNNR